MFIFLHCDERDKRGIFIFTFINNINFFKEAIAFYAPKMALKGLNWVSRAVLSADYDGVSFFDKRNQEYMDKSIKVV